MATYRSLLILLAFAFRLDFRFNNKANSFSRISRLFKILSRLFKILSRLFKIIYKLKAFPKMYLYAPF